MSENSLGSPVADAPGSPGRRRAEPLAEHLCREIYRYDFFQAVRLVARLFPDRKPVGGDEAASRECVRFRSLPSLNFPASQVAELRTPIDDSRPPEMVVAFLGLTGLNGALPHHYTEWIQERLRRKDRTLRDFLDLFNHRLLSLFYRSWEKYRCWTAGERALIREREELAAGPERARAFVIDSRPRIDPFSQVLLDLEGMGSPALRYRARVRSQLVPRTTLPDGAVRFYCGLLSQQHRSAVALGGLLQSYFGWPVRIVQLLGCWLPLDAEDQSRLGAAGNAELGRSAVVGSRVWNVDGKFRVRVGPLSYRQFSQLLPVGDAHRPLVDWTRLYAGAQFDFDLELILKAEDVPRTRLGRSAAGGSQLGWNTWCRSERHCQGEGRVVISIREEPRA